MRTASVLLAVTTALFGLSCTKSEATNPPEPAATPAEGTEQGGEAESGDLPPQLAERLAQMEQDAQAVRDRWTPELRDAITTLTTTQYPDTAAALDAVLQSPHRAPGNADRDAFRHPKQTLMHFGLQPDMKVFEYAQGAGWYTEILAPLLARDGTLYLAGYNGDADDPRERFGAKAMELFVGSPGNLYEKVELVPQLDLSGPPTLGAENSLDMVLVIRMMHNVHRAKMWDSLLPAIHTSLAPGGVLGVVQHRAPADANPDETAPQGYMPEPWLIEKIEGYGFKLESKAEVNANPKDTKDHPKGVWTLPPTLQLGDKDREKYTAIGESDRSTLKFVKVAG